MKRIICILLLLCACLTACGPKYKQSADVRELHEDCIEYIYFNCINPAADYYDSTYLDVEFVESWIKFEGDNDFELYIRIKYESKLEVADEWYFIRVLGEDSCEAKKASSLIVKMNTVFGFKYTDKIDKKWS